MKSKGLGDSIEKITKATGIKAAVKFLFGEDCGCQERKEWLNKKFRYNVECLKHKEYKYLKQWFSIHRDKVRVDDQRQILDIYNRVFSKNQKMTNCNSCFVRIIQDLKTVFNEYQEEQ